ncbi:MAG: thioredoxin domain-containing protein [Dehalococcoidia bacterium]
MSSRSRYRTSPPAASRSRTKAQGISARKSPGLRLTWLLGGGVAAIGAAFVVAVLLARDDTSTGASQQAMSASAQSGESMTAMAEANSGGPVRVLRGSHHTVYHSDQALPTAAAPRADGKMTLVWFSGTWCEVCETMEPYVHQTAVGYRDQEVLIEKSVDHARDDARRFAVRGTPTFVVLDPAGRELTRFHYQSASAFPAVMAGIVGR